jgi:ABC-type transporter Mla subunit MlaD
MERLNTLTQDIGVTQEDNQARLATQFDSLLQQVGIAVTTMEQNITQLRNTTTDAIGRMNRGADTLQKAATDFASAGQSVTGVLEKATPLTNQMQNAGLQMSQSGDTMRRASEQLSGMFERYQSVQKTTNDQVDQLKQLIASAKNEAGIRDQWIRDLEQAANQLSTAERHSQDHLNSINTTLEKVFKAFGDSMTGAVKDSFASVNSTIEGLNGVAQLLADELDQKRR